MTVNSNPHPDIGTVAAVLELKRRQPTESAGQRPLSLAFCVMAWINGGYE